MAENAPKGTEENGRTTEIPANPTDGYGPRGPSDAEWRAMFRAVQLPQRSRWRRLLDRVLGRPYVLERDGITWPTVEEPTAKPTPIDVAADVLTRMWPYGPPGQLPAVYLTTRSLFLAAIESIGERDLLDLGISICNARTHRDRRATLARRLGLWEW